MNTHTPSQSNKRRRRYRMGGPLKTERVVFTISRPDLAVLRREWNLEEGLGWAEFLRRRLMSTTKKEQSEPEAINA